MSVLIVKKKIKYNNVNLDEIDEMSGVEFEYFIAELLKNNGFYNVQVTKSSGDFGVDIICHKKLKTWVFQCKCYKSKLGLRPVQEIYCGKEKYNADKAVVITNSYFTPAAKELAGDLSVLLWDRDKLKTLLPKCHNIRLYKNKIDTHNKVEIKPISPPSFLLAKQKPIELGENQLMAGVYVIGKDIPPGTYDFVCILGDGSIHKFIDETTLLGASNYFKWLGFEHDYQYRQCVGVVCKEGEYLHIDGNIIVEIRRSRTVKINL